MTRDCQGGDVHNEGGAERPRGQAEFGPLIVVALRPQGCSADRLPTTR